MTDLLKKSGGSCDLGVNSSLQHSVGLTWQLLLTPTGQLFLSPSTRAAPVNLCLIRLLLLDASTFGSCSRWRSNPSGKCTQERLKQGTVTRKLRRAAHPSECARCGAGAGCSAITYQSLWFTVSATLDSGPIAEGLRSDLGLGLKLSLGLGLDFDAKDSLWQLGRAGIGAVKLVGSMPRVARDNAVKVFFLSNEGATQSY